MAEQGRDLLVILPERYPELFSQMQVDEISAGIQKEIAVLGQAIVTMTLTGIPGVFTVVVYAVLIPIIVFFLLKDRQQITRWLAAFLPDKRPLLNSIWDEMNIQFSNYARGKMVEIIVVGAASYVSFIWLDLRYAALLGLLVGLSVIIPYRRVSGHGARGLCGAVSVGGVLGVLLGSGGVYRDSNPGWQRARAPAVLRSG